MTDAQKRSYRAMAFMFIGIASAFGLVALGELVFRFEFFSGNVVPLALFLGVIGALLLQTVRQSDVEPDEVQLDREPAGTEPDFTSDAYSDPFAPSSYAPDASKTELEHPKD